MSNPQWNSLHSRAKLLESRLEVIIDVFITLRDHSFDKFYRNREIELIWSLNF